MNPYSNVYYNHNPQLPGGYNPQLPGGYPVFWYPPYPQAGYAPAVAPRSPRHRRPDLTPSPPPDVIAHSILGRPTHLQWLVTDDPFGGPGQYFPTANSNPTHIPNHILSQPATDPPLSSMQLLCEERAINIAVPGHVTVRHVLGAISGTLQELITRPEWNDLRSNTKRNAHKARCVRVAKGQATFVINEEAGAIRRVDLLGDRLFFLGLKPVGPRDDPVEWIVKLGSRRAEGRR